MRCAFAVLFLLPVLLAACGETEEPEVTAPAAAAARLAPAADAAVIAPLVPTDATSLLRISSASDLQAIVERLRTTLPMPLPPDVLPLMTAAFRLDPNSVERDRPFYACANLGERDQLTRLTLIAPVSDPEALAQAHPGGAGVAGSYVALSQLDKGYAAGGSPLPSGIPDGDISMRVDLTPIIAQYRTEIDEGLRTLEEEFAKGARQSLPAFDPSDMSTRMAEWVRRLVDSAETLDAAVNHDDGRFDIRVALTAREGSPLAKAAAAGPKSELVQLGRHLPPDMGVTMLLRWDIAGMNDLFLPLLVALMEKRPAGERQAMEDHVRRMNEAAALLTDDWAMALDFGKGGMRIAMVGGARDAPAYLAAYRELLQTPVLGQMGMAFKDEGKREVAGTTVERMRMTFDVQKYMAFLGLDEFSPEVAGSMNAAMALMLGEDGMVFELAAQERRLFVAAGAGGKLMDGMLQAEEPPAWFAGTTGALGGELGFLVRVEVRRCARGFSEMMAQLMPGAPVPAYPEGEDLPVVLYGAIDGRVYRGGLTLPLGELAEFFRSGKPAAHRATEDSGIAESDDG